VTRWLRPRGLVLFAGTVVVLVGCGWLLADTLVRRAVEAAGTALVGARVELEAADVGLFPPRLGLTGLAVTNPDAPLTNAVEVADARLRLDGGALLGGRLVVDAMGVEGVRFDTPRTRSGALARHPKAPGEKGPGLPLPAFSLPDVGTILKDNPLQSVAEGEALAKDLKAARAGWEDRLKTLPGRDRLDAYRTRAQAIDKERKGGLEGVVKAARDAAALKADVDKDLKTLRQAGDALQTDLATYRRRTEAVAAAPAAEAKRLVQRYQQGGALGLGTAFLEPTAARWADTALAWYRRLEPLASRAARAVRTEGGSRAVRPLHGAGVDVTFPESRPLPGFLVREATVWVQLAGGRLAGRVRDLTPEPEVLGRPLTFAFAGDPVGNLGSVRVEGTVNRVDPTHPDDRFSLRLSGVRVRDLALARGGPLPVTLAEGAANVQVTGTRRGDALDVNLKADLSGARFTTEAGPGETAKALAQALSGVRQATVQAALTGTLAAPRVSVRSDLDRVVAGALGAVAEARARALEADLTAEIRTRVEGRLAEARDGVAALDGQVAGPLGDRRQALEKVLADAVTGAGRKLPF
jgi:uncharacterized protein (TIGR03545 family)